MSEVKRYDISAFGGMSMDECRDGAYVNYEDYAALQAKCADLAAENAMLKAAHPQPFGHEMMKALDAYEKHQDEAPETGILDAFFILRDSIRVTTSATDAWVNEQHAIGVDMVVKYHMERSEALKEVNRKGYFYHSSAALDALDVAAQLRKGVEQK
nr:MAG TPA: hypothetical protein [Caudoviricetes sp.]